MNIEEIRKNAPCDATNYVQKKTRVQYWKKQGTRWLVWVGGAWVVANKSIYLDYALEQAKPLN